MRKIFDTTQQGIVTSSTKARLEELEHTKKELEINILQKNPETHAHRGADGFLDWQV